MRGRDGAGQVEKPFDNECNNGCGGNGEGVLGEEASYSAS